MSPELISLVSHLALYELQKQIKELEQGLRLVKLSLLERGQIMARDTKRFWVMVLRYMFQTKVMERKLQKMKN